MLIPNIIFAEGGSNPLKDGVRCKDAGAATCGREVVSQQWRADSTSVITTYGF